MQYRGAVLFLKGDWAEFATTVGLPMWSDAMRPCFKCNTDVEGMHLTNDISPISCPWTLNAPGDYARECARCEVVVAIVNALVRDRISVALKYDARQHSPGRGRCLVAAFPELGLQIGDRLTEHNGLGDVANFEKLVTFPARVVFWRPSLDSHTKHRNPILDERIGITTTTALAIDVLHCVHLGVMLTFCRYVIWFLLVAGAWGRRS